MSNNTSQPKKRRWGLVLAGVLVLLVLTLVCIIAFGVFKTREPLEQDLARPLIIIHAPSYNEQIQAGSAVLIHATARSGEGISRLELWADGVLIAETADDLVASANLTLSYPWIPMLPGGHVLVARAFTPDGIQGQAAIRVEAFEIADYEPDHHLIQEGETMEDIAEGYGLEIDQLAEHNPDLSLADLVPGDELVIPDDEPPSDPVAPGIADADEPPLPEAEAPADVPASPGLLEILEAEIFFQPLFEFLPGLRGEPTGLQIELLQLETESAYERLYCYLGLADNPPRRYPGGDDDAEAEASFYLDETAGDDAAIWSVEGSLGYDNTAIIFWPRRQALPLNLACVGVAGGGTTALDLGRWEGQIDTGYWAGISIDVGGAGSDGWFNATLRVNRVSDRGTPEPRYLDTTMTPPENARLDEERYSLKWDYSSEFDEEIDGFRIYLNGSMQFVEPSDARESFLPYEWFNPPCDTTYTFAVSAFRYGMPDGPESLPAIAILTQPEEGCHREIEITFFSLETYDLGGDGRRPAHHGDVGPVYGHFYANDQQVTFDTRASSRGGVDMPNGLNHHSFYHLGEMSADPTWHFSGIPTLIVEIPPGGSFEFGYHIMDQDYGRCRNSSDPGCDDLICDFSSYFYYEDSPSMDLDHHHEGTMLSENGRCRVTYRWGPAFGSPVGTGMEGWEPLPAINIEAVRVEEESGDVQVEVRNIGTAAWPRRELAIELQTREGVSLGVYTWPDFALGAGQRTVLMAPDMRLAAPFDGCVLIDPFDDVLEAHERSGAWVHRPVCPPVPDLVIQTVHLIPGGASDQLSVTIQNIGNEPLENRAVSIQATLLDGTPLYIGGSYPNISLERFQYRTLNFGGVTETIREQMGAGYRVVVNPDGLIAEQDMSNNAFDIPAAKNLMIRVISLRSPWSLRRNIDFRLKAYAVSGPARRELGNLYFSDLDWGSCIRDTGCIRDFLPRSQNNVITWFPIYGDEDLEVAVHIRHGALSDWGFTDVFRASNNWRASGWGPLRNCSGVEHSTPGRHSWTLDRFDDSVIRIIFNVCEHGP